MASGSGVTAMSYAVYNPSGAIAAVYQCPATHISYQCEPGQNYVKCPNDVTARSYYVANGAVTPRPQTPISFDKTAVQADGVDKLTLSGMSAETQVTVVGPASAQFTASGTDQLTFAIPGEYTLTATAPFPATPVVETVNAT